MSVAEQTGALIIGGSVLFVSLLLLLIQIVLAAGSAPAIQQFFGNVVTSGGTPVADDLEIRVKVQHGGTLLPLDLTPRTINTQGNIAFNGKYGLKNKAGQDAFFELPADQASFEGIRGPLNSTDQILFFIVEGTTESQALLTDDKGTVTLSIPYSSFDVTQLDLTVEEGILTKPKPRAPIGLINDDTPLFQWDPSTGSGVQYRLQLVKSGDSLDVGPFAFNTGDIIDPQFQVQAGNELEEAFFDWRVIATDIVGGIETSDTVSFNVDTSAPDPPQLIGLIGGDQNPDSTPTFVWKVVTGGIPSSSITNAPESGGITYALQIDFETGDFTNPVFSGDGIVDEDPTKEDVQFTLPKENRLEPRNYKWRVRAVDAAGNAGVFSESQTFARLPSVDLLLEPDPLTVRAGTEFTITIVVEHEAQPVTAIDAFLNFSTTDLEVVRIEPGSTLEVILTGDFDNQKGTIDYGAVTIGPAPAEDFVLARVTFKAKERLDSAVQVDSQITFNCRDVRGTFVAGCQEFPRTVIAAHEGEPVLGSAFGVTATILDPIVIIRLQNAKFSSEGFEGFARNETVPITIKVEPNGQRASALDVLLDFGTGDLEALSIEPVATGDTIVSAIDNATGTITFSITTGDPTTGDYDLAVVTFRARKASQGLSVGFSEEHPERTEAALRGLSVLRDSSGSRQRSRWS